MKKELYIPIIVIALTIVFAAVSLMVYLSNGKHYWIKKKLKIGAILLGLTFYANSCDVPPEVTCYDPAMPNNYLMLDQYGDTLTYSIADTMRIEIANTTYPYFSYELLNDTQDIIKSDILENRDTLTTNNYASSIIFNEEFTPGTYKISFYGELSEQIQKTEILGTYIIRVE